MDPDVKTFERAVATGRRKRRVLVVASVAVLGLTIAGSAAYLVSEANRRLARANTVVHDLQAERVADKRTIEQLVAKQEKSNRDCAFSKSFTRPLRGEVARSNGRWVAWAWFDVINDGVTSVTYSLLDSLSQNRWDTPSITVSQSDHFCVAFDVTKLVEAGFYGMISGNVSTHFDANATVHFPLGKVENWSMTGVGTDYLEIASATADEYVALTDTVRAMGFDARVFERAGNNTAGASWFALALGPVPKEKLEELRAVWSEHAHRVKMPGVRVSTQGTVVAGRDYVNWVYPEPRCTPPRGVS